MLILAEVPPPDWWNQFCAILSSAKTYLTGDETFSFVLNCAILGLIVTFIDFMAGYLRNQKSLLGISYGKKNMLVVFMFWIIGAGMLGFLGAYLNLLKPTPVSVCAVAVGWPLLFSKFVANLLDGDPNDGGDADESTDEEED